MSAWTGTATLVRVALRRDRIVLPVWIVVLVVSAAGSAAATSSLYPTLAPRLEAAAAANGSSALLALYGRVYDPSSLGALALWKLGGLGAAMVAVLTMLTVVRHTRAEEEAGRLELLGATVLGRGAALAAALIVGAGTAVVLGSATAVALVAVGLPLTGSIAFGAGWAACGVAFAAVAAVTAQLTRSAGAANGLSTVVLGAAFALRAMGDAADASGPGWLSWLSPIGWGQQVRPFAGERWWVLVLPVVFAAVLAMLAFRLNAGRDIDAGLMPERPGPAVAAASLGSPLALAWRLHRGVLAAWIAGFLLLGALCGNIASNTSGFLDSPQAQEFITQLGGQQALTDAFLAVELGFMGVFAAVYAIQAVLRLRHEELAHRADPVLAAGVSRIRWTGSHLVLAALGTTALTVAAGLGAGLTRGAQTGDVGRGVLRLVGAALAQLPAALVLGGLVVALFGLAPRLVTAGWLVLAGCVLIAELGPLLQLQPWVMDLSPFTHAPRLPGAAATAAPLVGLTLIALGLGTVGLVGIRRRDIA